VKRLRWGLIGCGDISSKRVAPALRDLPNCEFVAVSRSNFDLAESFAKQFGARRWIQDWRELVADPEIDAVYVATPVHLHAEQAIAAGLAGKHVLCEKPMAMTVKECDAMIAACLDGGVKLGIAYYRHFYPAIEFIKSIIAKGEIGIPVLTQINVFEKFDPGPSNPRRWLVDAELSGGGPMLDFGCHRVEVLLDLFGDATRINGLAANIVFDRKVEDTASALLQFAGGTCAVLCVTHGASEPQDTLHIFGSLGSIHVENLNQGNIVVRTAKGDRVEARPPHPNFHLPLINDFTAAVLEDREPIVDGAIGRRVSVILEQIYDSAAHVSFMA
jgi:predicted dehydrogenase